MQSHERAQVRRVLQELRSSSRAEIEGRLRETVERQAQEAKLKSGSTLRLVIRAIEEVLSGALSNGIDQIKGISTDPDALVMVREFLQGQRGFIDGHLEGFAALCRGASLGVGFTDEILEGLRKQFEQSYKRLESQIELQQPAFRAPQSLLDPSEPESAKNLGGRPRAKHWDEMWATIAASLYNGDLKPESQAAIERAMKSLLMEHGVYPGDTPVRDRARQLWSKLQKSD